MKKIVGISLVVVVFLILSTVFAFGALKDAARTAGYHNTLYADTIQTADDTTTAVTVDTNLDVNGNTELNGNVAVTGSISDSDSAAVTVADDLDVSGDIGLTGSIFDIDSAAVTVADDLIVTGDTQLGDLVFNGGSISNSVSTGMVYIDDGLSVTGSIAGGGDGVISFMDNLDVWGTNAIYNSNGAVNIADGLVVANSLVVNDDSVFEKDLTVREDLRVTGQLLDVGKRTSGCPAAEEYGDFIDEWGVGCRYDLEYDDIDDGTTVDCDNGKEIQEDEFYCHNFPALNNDLVLAYRCPPGMAAITGGCKSDEGVNEKVLQSYPAGSKADHNGWRCLFDTSDQDNIVFVVCV